MLVFVEKAGCGRLVGTLHANDPRFVRLLGRAKSGWAVVASSMPFSFDEIEEKLEHDGTKYVTWTRRRDYPPVPPGKPRVISPWSPWVVSEAE